MKSLLERLELLCEATFNIDKAVDYIYDKAGFGQINRILRSNLSPEEMAEKMSRFKQRHFTWQGTSRDLPGKDVKRAHKINPVTIRVGAGSQGSFYRPDDHGGEIQVSISVSGVDVLKQAMYNSDKLKGWTKGQYAWLEREFDAENIKGTIAHELSHWLNDSLHNRAVKGMIDVAREHGDIELKGHYVTVDQSPVELDAQVHAIKQIRKTVGKRAFDKLTWEDLFKRKGSLMSNLMAGTSRGGENLSKKDFDEVSKRWLKRLSREGLIGKNMKKFPSYYDFKLLVFKRYK